MEQAGIRVVETPVGDRYVLEALDEGDYTMGGEQSGHVIFRDRATTGDGLLTGVLLADVVKRSNTSLADLAASAMTRLPQVLLNVPVAERVPGPRRSRSPPRSRPSRRGSRAPDECLCVRAEQNRCCGSWSRRPTPRGQRNG